MVITTQEYPLATLSRGLAACVQSPPTPLSSFPFATPCRSPTTTTKPAAPMTATGPKTRDEWLKALDDLPSSPEKIPAFFFAHSSPMMLVDVPGLAMGKSGPLPRLLNDFGETLIKKYKPKAIVVFSAHWDTDRTRLGTRWSHAALVMYAYACG